MRAAAHGRAARYRTPATGTAHAAISVGLGRSLPRALFWLASVRSWLDALHRHAGVGNRVLGWLGHRHRPYRAQPLAARHRHCVRRGLPQCAAAAADVPVVLRVAGAAAARSRTLDETGHALPRA